MEEFIWEYFWCSISTGSWIAITSEKITSENVKSIKFKVKQPFFQRFQQKDRPNFIAFLRGQDSLEVLDSEENPDLRFGLPKLKELILRSPQYRFNITRYPIIEDSPMLESFSLLDLSHEVNLYLYYLKSSSLSSPVVR